MYKAARKSAARTRAQLARLLSFDGISDPKTSLGSALQILEKRYNISLDINEQAFKDEGVDDVRSLLIGKVIPKMQGVELSLVLRRVLERLPSKSGVTFYSRNGVVEISTVRAYRYEIRLRGEIVRPVGPRLPQP